jgi:hypothetical protein
MNDPRKSIGSSKRLLAVFPLLTHDFEKSAHMLVVKYLPACGWEPTVLTVDKSGIPETLVEEWCGVRVIRYVPKGIRWRVTQPFYKVRRTKRISYLQQLMGQVANRCLLPVTTALSFPDRFIAAKRELVELGYRLHADTPFDAIASLYSPLTSHLIARQLTRGAALPWIALTKDFYSWPDELVASWWERLGNQLKRWYEPHTLQGADAIISISEYMNKYLRRLLPDMRIESLPHCYDETAFEPGLSPPQTLLFRLVTVGLTSEHDEAELTVLFECLAELLHEGAIHPATFRIRFVGHGGHIPQHRAEQYGCQAILEVCPPVPHADAMRELQTATCLFFKQHRWGTRRRLMEYLGSRRPILAFPAFPGELSHELIRQYGAGRIAEDKASLKAAIRELVRQYRHDGKLEFSVNEELVRQQSAEVRALELASILNGVVEAAMDGTCKGTYRTRSPIPRHGPDSLVESTAGTRVK